VLTPGEVIDVSWLSVGRELADAEESVKTISSDVARLKLFERASITGLSRKPPFKDETAPGMGRGRVVSTLVTSPYGGSVGQPPLGGCPGTSRASHKATPLEGRRVMGTRSDPPGGV